MGSSIAYEIERQEKAILDGEKIKQETRGWDESKQKTVSQRSKEGAHDYRYFPEPDLPPMTFDDEYINRIKADLPELPNQKRERFSSEYNLSESQVEILVRNPELAEFFENAVSELKSISKSANPEMVYNYLSSDVRGLEADRGMTISQSKLVTLHIAQIVSLIGDEKISSRVAKDILARSFDEGVSPEEIVQQEGLLQVSSENELENVVKEVIDVNDKVWYDYKSGKENALQFLIGQVMAKTKGKANPAVVRELFKKMIS